MAEKDWAHCFMMRYPELGLRKLKVTSGARAMGLNKVAATQFSSLVNELSLRRRLLGKNLKLRRYRYYANSKATLKNY